MTQMQLVPENHTDYIFSVAGEELGFIGCMLIIGLLVLLIARIFYVSIPRLAGFPRHSRYIFGRVPVPGFIGCS